MIEIHSTPNSATPVCGTDREEKQSPDQNNLFLLNLKKNFPPQIC